MRSAKIQESLDVRHEGHRITGTSIGDDKWALDVRSQMAYQEIGSDAVDSFDVNENEITAAAHAAKPGDRIRFTSGSLDTLEFVVFETTASTIKVGECLSPAPSAADTFVIIRPISLKVGSDGGLAISTVGLATEAKQDSQIILLTSIDGKDFATQTTLAALNTKVPAQGAAVTASSTPVNIASDQIVPVSAAALPLPSGAATAANQASILAELALDIIDTAFIDYSSSNLPGNASNPLELVASLSANVKAIQAFDEAGVPFEIMTGAVASEVRKLVQGSGTNETTRAQIASGTRVSVRRLDAGAVVATGFITVNFLG